MNSLAVIVPAVNSLPDLLGCLAALARDRASVPPEVLVVNRLGDASNAAIRSEAPWVRILPVPATTAIPQMRALAFREAHRQGPGIGRPALRIVHVYKGKRDQSSVWACLDPARP